jgi:hypothetical protein
MTTEERKEHADGSYSVAYERWRRDRKDLWYFVKEPLCLPPRNERC